MSKRDVTVHLPAEGRSAQVAAAVDRLVAWLARHWLALFNGIVALFVLAPFLAPVLMQAGVTGPARLIYLLYRPTCHQLPERSFFLFGPQTVYSVAELEAENAVPAGLNIFEREMLRYIGDPQVGYKVAFCERDAAIYGSILLSGLIFALLRGNHRRGRGPAQKLPIKIYLILLIPMAIDGATQLVGWRESGWELRLVTGALFGVATVWLAYPYVEDAMNEALQNLTRTNTTP